MVDSAASWFIFLCSRFRYWFFYRAASLDSSCWMLEAHDCVLRRDKEWSFWLWGSSTA